MTKPRKKNGIITVFVIILILLLSFGLIIRFFNPFETIGVTMNGKEISNETTNLIISSKDTFTVECKSPYELKIYGAGDEQTDFIFTADGQEYSWYKDVASADNGKGKDFTKAFNISRNGKNFTLSGTVNALLAEVYNADEIVLPASLPQGDKFRLEIIGKNICKELVLALGFDLSYIFITPDEIVF